MRLDFYRSLYDGLSVKRMVGFAFLTLFYLIPMVCKLSGVSETHRINAVQPTLRDGKIH